ncbi:MAG: MMPL family transporter [Sphaerochaetaceae bacterium]|nr:MMPL family transporter [Sphaerochaetaceae bacterium]
MEKVLNTILKRPMLTILVVLVVSIGFFFIMEENTRMETDLDEYMPESNPAFVYSNQAEDWFNIRDGIVIAIQNKNGIYNSSTLSKIKNLTKDLQKMEGIEKSDVTSLYTADNIIGSEYGLEVEPFYTKVPESEEDLINLKAAVQNNDMIANRLISEDETVALIMVEISDDVFTDEFYQKINDLTYSYEGDETLYVAGRPIVEGTLAALAPADMAKMIPIVILVIILVLYLLMKSVRATFMTLMVVLFSVLWTFGLMAAVDIPIYAVSTMIPVMLIAIGVADGIHIINYLRQYKSNNPNAKDDEALSITLKNLWKPVVMTSVTTAVGFISLLTSQVYPIKYFGIFTAFGVMVAMCFSLVLLPAGLKLMGLPKWKKSKRTTTKISSFSKSYSMLLIRHKYIFYFLTVLILVFSLWGITKVWIDSSFISQFDKNTDIVLSDNFINNNFGGTSTLNVILDASEEGTFKNPEVLILAETMQNDLENSLNKVGNSFALTDYLKRMNMVMNADNPSFNTIPQTREMIAQYLLLYEMSGDPDNLLKVVDYNYKKANMTFQLKDDTSQTITSAINLIEKYIPDFEKLGISVNYAGSGYRGLVFSNLILEGQILSIFLSLLIVVILLSFMFSSLRIGLIASVPIVTTAFISFGIMGLLNIPLSTTTALLSSIAIGIGIDYAVHFIETYKLNSVKTTTKELTLEKTMSYSGKAILYNAIVVIAGFLVLLFSLFPLNRTLGALVSLNMFTSFIGTLTIMAVLLYQSNIYFNNRNKEKKL